VRTSGRRRRPSLGLALTAAVTLAWLLLLRPTALGGPATWVVIRGDSMEPTYHTGDLVIVRRESTYAVGDVVAYEVPEGDVGGGAIVIHRLIGSDATGYDVQGDNNQGPDPWRPTTAEILGRAWLAAPALGRVVTWLHQPPIAASLAAAVVVTLVLGRPGAPVRRRSLGEPEGAGSAIA
jgi:signal peptidase I